MSSLEKKNLRVNVQKLFQKVDSVLRLQKEANS